MRVEISHTYAVFVTCAHISVCVRACPQERERYEHIITNCRFVYYIILF
jgi:hypothetical protein